MSKNDLLNDDSIPDDENIFADIPVEKRPLADNVVRIFDDTIFWQCSSCGTRIEVEDERDDFIQSCESCYTVNRIRVENPNRFKTALEIIIDNEKLNTWMKDNGFIRSSCEERLLAIRRLARESLAESKLVDKNNKLPPDTIIQTGFVAYHVNDSKIVDDVMVLNTLGGYANSPVSELSRDGWTFVCDSKKYQMGDRIDD